MNFNNPSSMMNGIGGQQQANPFAQNSNTNAPYALRSQTNSFNPTQNPTPSFGMNSQNSGNAFANNNPFNANQSSNMNVFSNQSNQNQNSFGNMNNNMGGMNGINNIGPIGQNQTSNSFLNANNNFSSMNNNNFNTNSTMNSFNTNTNNNNTMFSNQNQNKMNIFSNFANQNNENRSFPLMNTMNSSNNQMNTQSIPAFSQNFSNQNNQMSMPGNNFASGNNFTASNNFSGFQSAKTGTTQTPYEQTKCQIKRTVGSTNNPKTEYYTCITKMPAYQGKTRLELQLQDYELLRKNQAPEQVLRLAKNAVQTRVLSQNTYSGQGGSSNFIGSNFPLNNQQNNQMNNQMNSGMNSFQNLLSSNTNNPMNSMNTFNTMNNNNQNQNQNGFLLSNVNAFNKPTTNNFLNNNSGQNSMSKNNIFQNQNPFQNQQNQQNNNPNPFNNQANNNFNLFSNQNQNQNQQMNAFNRNPQMQNPQLNWSLQVPQSTSFESLAQELRHNETLPQLSLQNHGNNDLFKNHSLQNSQFQFNFLCDANKSFISSNFMNRKTDQQEDFEMKFRQTTQNNNIENFYKDKTNEESRQQLFKKNFFSNISSVKQQQSSTSVFKHQIKPNQVLSPQQNMTKSLFGRKDNLMPQEHQLELTNNSSWYQENFLDQSKSIFSYDIVALNIICQLPKEIKESGIKICKNISLGEFKKRILHHLFQKLKIKSELLPEILASIDIEHNEKIYSNNNQKMNDIALKDGDDVHFRISYDGMALLQSQQIYDFQLEQEKEDSVELLEDVSFEKSEPSFSQDQVKQFEEPQKDDKEYLPILYHNKIQLYPDYEQLIQMDAESLQRVEGLQIGNEFGKVHFLGQTDITFVDFDKDVIINENGVDVYPIEGRKPELGHKLNREAIVVNFSCVLWDKYRDEEGRVNHQKVIKSIEKHCAKRGCQLVSYEPSSGHWSFKVPGF